MNILVTGGAGFIGSNFIRHLCNTYLEYKVINLDALTYAGNLSNLRDVEEAHGDRYVFIKGDIADQECVASVLDTHTPDFIVNFAAESHVDRSFVGAADFIRTNILGVENLLHASRKRNIPFLQISTDEVYGNIPDGYVDENAPLRPSNPYAASKAGADLLVQTYMMSTGAPVMMVRGTNNYGPYQYPEKLIPLAITNLWEGKKIPVHGSGEHMRSWLHVFDFASGIDLVMHNAKPGSIYNISGEHASNLDILKRTIQHALGRDADMNAHLEYVSDRPSSDMRYAPTSQKIREELGWEPKYTLDNAFPSVVAWYRDNEAWWRELRGKKEFLDHYEKQRHAKYY